MSTQKIGVLMMAYGGPNAIEDLPGYLADIRNGRVTSPAVLEEISNNYRQIGGKSPLLDFTQAQIKAVAERFGDDVHFYLGMRHWSPWIEDVVGQMLDDGITDAVALVLAPHYSSLSVAKYQKKIKAGLKLHRGNINFHYINSYHDAPKLIEAFANRVIEGMDRWPITERDSIHVVFSAHSLPVRIIKSGDPYDTQLRETAGLIALKAGLKPEQWSWSYQSAGRSPEPWLGPQLEEYLPDLHADGINNVVSCCVGFVCDHVEILYDIDIEAQAVAQELGMRLERPPALNTDPLFIDTLSDIIQAKIDQI